MDRERTIASSLFPLVLFALLSASPFSFFFALPLLLCCLRFFVLRLLLSRLQRLSLLFHPIAETTLDAVQ
jgi:hypothetical protein